MRMIWRFLLSQSGKIRNCLHLHDMDDYIHVQVCLRLHYLLFSVVIYIQVRSGLSGHPTQHRIDQEGEQEVARMLEALVRHRHGKA